MVWAAVFDGDQVVSGGHGGVGDLVALCTLLAVHLHLGWAVNGHGQSTRAGRARVHNELTGRS